ncbi:ATP-binding protein [uncultured Dokdonia sp.]|uniref:ATP-binding protein n=1 Tax=uncultured Dokdonia sp. TaxID=575653 RepID=UPI002601D3F0|nr:ATP-binding protein [uncultured Dokdonia sp.]
MRLEQKGTQQIFDYLKEVILWRLENTETPLKVCPLKYTPSTYEESSLGNYIAKHALDQEEIISLLLSLVPHVYPTFLRDVSIESENGVLYFFSQTRADQKNADPTAETILYALAGDDVAGRIAAIHFLHNNRLFNELQVLHTAPTEKGEPAVRGKLLIYQDAFQEIVLGSTIIPKLSEEFPAQEIKTQMTWDDLILSENTLQKLQNSKTWLKHNDTLLEELGMKKRLKPGYRVLFYGAPGTGKTLAASLLGKYTGKSVFRVDLSVLVSKYIGETEKHLANLFNKAEKKDWILFFDEADSVFGKRTNVRDAHDKYANQGVSYLLQKIEAYPGMVILASNYKDNIDTAFMRRFQSIIHFELPKAKERLRIWKHNIPEKLEQDASLKLDEIASKYVLNGSNIMNCIQDASLKALANKDRILTQAMVLESIKKEYHKEDKVF